MATNYMQPRATAVRLAIGLTLLSASVGLAWAQVSRPTQAEKETAPVQFRAEVTGDSKFENFEVKATPAGVYPKTGPRDFTGVYSGGPPGEAAPGEAPGGTADDGSGEDSGRGKPGQICVPEFPAGIGAIYPTHVFMTADRMTIIQEENHRIRRIYIGGEHAKNGKPTYGGDGIARWDGDTLVIETINIRGQEEQTLVEKIRKIDGGRSLEIKSSTNGGAESTTTAAWRPDLDWVEDICEDFGEAFGEGYL